MITLDALAPTWAHVLVNRINQALAAIRPDNAVKITGGSINGTPIGQTTPAAGAFTTTQVTTLTATNLATLATTQVGLLTATKLGNITSFVANGTTLVSVQVGTLTTTSVALFGLQTVGGTVGAIPTVKTVDTATGKMTVAATAADTSTYNLVVMG